MEILHLFRVKTIKNLLASYVSLLECMKKNDMPMMPKGLCVGHKCLWRFFDILSMNAYV